MTPHGWTRYDNENKMMAQCKQQDKKHMHSKQAQQETKQNGKRQILILEVPNVWELLIFKTNKKRNHDYAKTTYQSWMTFDGRGCQ